MATIEYCVKMKNKNSDCFATFNSTEESVFKFYEDNKNKYDTVNLIRRTIEENIIKSTRN